MSLFLWSRRFRASRVFFAILLLLLGITAGAFLRGRMHHQQVAAAPLTPEPAATASPALLSSPATAVLSVGSSVPVPNQHPAAARPPAVVPASPNRVQLAAPPAAPPIPAGSAERLLAESKTKCDGGDLPAGRAILNAPLVSERLGEIDAEAVRRALMEINEKLVFSAKLYASDPFETPIVVQSGTRLQKLANQYDITWPLICRVNGYEPTDAGARRVRAGRTLKIIKGPFAAVVIKSAFRMDLYLGGLPGESGAIYVTSFPVGLGKDDSTPTGLWTVEPHEKVRNPIYYSPRGEGIYKPDDPKNPLGGYWIGLKGEDGSAVGKTSYGIHGTIEPASIGKQSSMGCIRLGHNDIALVFDMLIEGKSRVVVKP